jgi:hypothetical protein
MQAELPYLYQVIKRLMDTTYKTRDQKLKPLLATIEYKARKGKGVRKGKGEGKGVRLLI